MNDCLFCKIGKKEIPAKLVYEDAEIFAFEDIQPQAPTHILICPQKHLVSLTDATAEDAAMLGKLQLSPRSLQESANSPMATAPWSTMDSAQGSPCFICTCICWEDAIFDGRRDKSRTGFSLSVFDFCEVKEIKTRQAEACPTCASSRRRRPSFPRARRRNIPCSDSGTCAPGRHRASAPATFQK